MAVANASASDLDQKTAGSMIKSELVQRIAGQNPHLYQRASEHRQCVLGEITGALARRGPRRTARTSLLLGCTARRDRGIRSPPRMYRSTIVRAVLQTASKARAL